MKKWATFFGALMLVMAVSVASASAGKKVYKVCEHGCKYSKIQKAVAAVKNGSNSKVEIAPGSYHEGVVVKGHKYDGLKIKGTGKDPGKVIINGKNATVSGPGGSGKAQNGIEGLNVDNLAVQNLEVKKFEANGVFIHADNDTSQTCHGFKMKNDWASFNKSYGLFAFNCTGGSITGGKTWGQGDSGIYIGNTPPQDNPKWTDISGNSMYKNVLGYSGTNSKYVDIHDNVIYNNGAGVVPNTLDSEHFEPAATGKVHDNEIFWNNFNYYKPESPVKTVSGGLGGGVNYPTGIGVALFGTTGWKVYDNKIFGNFMWGTAQFSDPTNSDALNQSNQVTDNVMGKNGNDTNRFDLFNDGSGSHNCFAGNSTSTQDVQGGNAQTTAQLYPSCPNTSSGPPVGTGTTTGDSGQIGELLVYVSQNPPCKQENFWVKHSHPAYKNYKPYTVPGGC